MVYVVVMARDLDRPRWKGQRPWVEIWVAVGLDAGRRRALWIRQTMFVPRQGDARTTIWGAWFDADATPPAQAAKRYLSIEHATVNDKGGDSGGNDDPLIRIEDSWLG